MQTGDVDMGKTVEKTNRKKLNFVSNHAIQTGILITFDKLEQLEPSGKIFNVHIPWGIRYQGYGDLFFKMERIYNLLDKPQAEFQMRSWKKTDWSGTPLENTDGWNFTDDCFDNFKEIYTSGNIWLYAETMFRCHGTWQGMVKAAKADTLYYRSALELMHYIVEYLKEK